MCTSFAAYFEKPVYGMNFDFSAVNVYVSLKTDGHTKALYLLTEVAGKLLPQIIFNTNGLFFNVQANNNSGMHFLKHKDVNSIEFLDLGEQLKFLKSVDEVKSLIQGKSISFQSLDFEFTDPVECTHCLIADKSGNAMILEYDYEETFITPIQGLFQVMTNFPLCKEFPEYDENFNGLNCYKTAYDYIHSHQNGFNTDHGMEVLRLTNRGEATRYSIVFDGASLEAFFCLNSRFDRVFSMNLNKETLNTAKGFHINRSIKLTGDIFLLNSLVDLI